MKKYRNELQIAVDVTTSIYKSTKQVGFASVSNIMHGANISYSRLKPILQKLSDGGAIRQDGKCYSITSDGIRFVDEYYKLIEIFKEPKGKDFSGLPEPEEVRARKMIKEYQRSLSRDYVEDRKINWDRLIIGYIDVCNAENRRVKNRKMIPHVISAAEHLIGRRFDPLQKGIYVDLIRKKQNDVIYLGWQTIVKTR